MRGAARLGRQGRAWPSRRQTAAAASEAAVARVAARLGRRLAGAAPGRVLRLEPATSRATTSSPAAQAVRIWAAGSNPGQVGGSTVSAVTLPICGVVACGG